MVKTEGSGILFLKAYGHIIEIILESSKPIYVDEDSLIAFEEGILNIKANTGNIRKLLTS